MSSVKKNFIFNSLYQILTFLLPLITTPYLTRVLGAEGTGLYAYYFSIARYFVLFAILGLNNYGNRLIASVKDDRKQVSKVFSEIYSMQIFTSFIAFLAYIIYSCLFAQSKMAWIMAIYVISAILDINWLFFGLENFKLTVTRSVIIKLVSVACIFLFVKSPADVGLYGVILTMSYLVNQIALIPFVKKYADFSIPSLKDVFPHLKGNLILFIPVIAVSLYKTMDKIMLGSMTNMTEVGYYEYSESIINIPIALVQALGTVMLPKMSYLAATGKKSEGKLYFHYSIVFVSFLASAMCFGIMSVCREFVPLFFGTGYDSCVLLFEILAPSCLFMAIANVIRTQYLIPQNKDKTYIFSVTLGAIVNLLINFILIPKHAASGAAIGTLIAEAVVCFSQFFSVDSTFCLNRSLKKAFPFIVAGMLMYFAERNIHIKGNAIVALFIKIIVGVIIYFSILFFVVLFFKIVRKKSLRETVQMLVK